MQSKDYWIKRALQREADSYIKSGNAIRRLRAIYDMSASRLVRMVKNVLFNYMKSSGISSEQEAKKLLSTQETNEVMAALQEEYAKTGSREALAKLNAPAYSYRISRIQAIRKAIDAETAWLDEKESQAGAQRLIETYDDAYYKTMHDAAKSADKDITFKPLSQRDVTEALENRWKGENYSERVWKNTHLVAKEAGKIVDAGLTSGATVAQMSHDIMDLFDVAYYAAARLVRTEINRMHNDATIKSYESMGIEEYTFLATLDARTCSVCGALDNKHFKVSEARTGVNLPPMHPNDRCTTVAYYPGEDITGTRTARDPETGKNYKVNRKLTYEEWRKEISEKYGADSLEKAQKRYANLKSDTAEQRSMQKVLGKDIPPKIADFQDLKYNDPEKWKLMKLDYTLQKQAGSNPKSILLNSDQLRIDERKYTKYLFDPTNKRGYAKGKAIMSRLGYGINNYQELDTQIKKMIQKYPAVFKGNNGYGGQYETVMVFKGLLGKPAKVICATLIKDGETIPSMTTFYIDK